MDRSHDANTTDAYAHRRARAVLDIIASQYADPELNLRSVAKAVSLTPQHLCVVLQRETGHGFREHLMDTRLAAAERLLRNSFMSVKQIATAVGYNNTGSFDRQFHRKHKCSPTQWRRSAELDAPKPIALSGVIANRSD